MKTSQIYFTEDTAIKIQFNKKFNFYEALTAAINPKTKKTIQKFGNDFNCNAATKKDCILKIKNILNF